MRRRATRRAAENGGKAPAPAERHKKFIEENKEWDRQVEESLTDLTRLAGEDVGSEPKPAKRDAAGV